MTPNLRQISQWYDSCLHTYLVYVGVYFIISIHIQTYIQLHIHFISISYTTSKNAVLIKDALLTAIACGYDQEMSSGFLESHHNYPSLNFTNDVCAWTLSVPDGFIAIDVTSVDIYVDADWCHFNGLWVRIILPICGLTCSIITS